MRIFRFPWFWQKKLTTCNIKITGLSVEWEQLEVHGAGARERDPDGVEDVAVGEHAHVQVGLQDVVKSADLLVSEEGVRHPHLGRVSHCQVANLV